ncbi:hypothetical protein AX16_000630 [Volvariella volvacea WC 439]|nr:hypothetical protein AX16_000630 [Volvariella volvacea WC 439]
MANINTIYISPPLINSSCAWSSDFDQLRQLYESQYTGAVTTRTATIDGFKENDSHTVAFASKTTSTINSYGYSPYPLSTYLEWVRTLLTAPSNVPSNKPIIISITASSSATLSSMVQSIQALRASLNDQVTPGSNARIAIETNTSCPNIPGSSPSGYAFQSLLPLLQVLSAAFVQDESLTIGLKLPPFVYREQFLAVIEGVKTLEKGPKTKRNPIAFFTCTNTLGNSLLFSDQALAPGGEVSAESRFALPTPLGGLAGDALHPLALGNVYTFSQLLHGDAKTKESGADDTSSELRNIEIIGVGGVTSPEAVKRMLDAGASVVGSATLFGALGVKAFEVLSPGLN